MIAKTTVLLLLAGMSAAHAADESEARAFDVGVTITKEGSSKPSQRVVLKNVDPAVGATFSSVQNVAYSTPAGSEKAVEVGTVLSVKPRLSGGQMQIAYDFETSRIAGFDTPAEGGAPIVRKASDTNVGIAAGKGAGRWLHEARAPGPDGTRYAIAFDVSPAAAESE